MCVCVCVCVSRVRARARRRLQTTPAGNGLMELQHANEVETLTQAMLEALSLETTDSFALKWRHGLAGEKSIDPRAARV